MLEIILLTVFTIVFAVLAWRNLVLAISFIVFALSSYLIRFEVFNIPLTLLEIMILTLFAVFILKRFFDKENQSFLEKIGLKTIKFSNYKWLILAWLFAATVAVFVSDNRLAALGVWKAYFIEPILFFIVFINTIKSKQDLNKIFNALGVSAIAISVFAIYQKFTGAFIFNETWFDPATRRVTSFFGYPNAVGLYLAPIAVLFIGKFCQWFFARLETFKNSETKNWIIKLLKPKFRPKAGQPLADTELLLPFFYLIIITTSVLAIWFARSEGAIFGLAVGCLLLGLLLNKLRPITLLAAGAIVAALILTPSFGHWAVDKANLRDFSGQLRLVIWQETQEMLAASPVFGAGLANFQTAVAPYHHAKHIFEVYLYPHQIILNFWSELGIFGVLIFIWLVVKFFFNYLKVPAGNRDDYKILLAIILAILAHGLVDVPYFKNDLSVMWWLWVGAGEVFTKITMKKG
jgi:O-antigen ligase